MRAGLVLLLALAMAGCASPAAPGSGSAERAYVVTVFLDSTTSHDHTYAIMVQQGGVEVASKQEQAPANFPFHGIVFSPTVRAGDAVVSIRENGTEMATATVHPQGCSSGEVAASITAMDTQATIKSECS